MKSLKDKKFEYEFYAIEDIEDENFEEEVYIGETTMIEFGFPDTDDDYEKLELLDAIELFKEADEGKIVDDYKFFSCNKAFYRVYTKNYDEINFRGMDFFNTDIIVDGVVVKICIEGNITPFGIKIALDGDYNEYVPPILCDEYFIVIESENDISEELADKVFQSYLFELSSRFNIELSKYIRSITLYEFENNQESEMKRNAEIVMNVGEGLEDVYKLYNSSANIENADILILNYCKVIEYISQTVIRKKIINSALNKLETEKAKRPDANFIVELEKMFEDNRTYKKDLECYKLTISTCCEIFEIKDYAPEYLRKVKKIKSNYTEQCLKDSQNELAVSISNTRNMIVHAKTNYSSKGEECPQDQMIEFSQMMKVIAQQAIRWFKRQDKSFRVLE